MNVGIGKASDLQVNVTVCPMQDIDVDEVRPCMTAGSVNYQRKKTIIITSSIILTTYKGFELC